MSTALKASQRIVNTYAEFAIQLLLPELEAGLLHYNKFIGWCGTDRRVVIGQFGLGYELSWK